MKLFLLVAASLCLLVLIAVFGNRTDKPPENNGFAFTTLPEDGKAAFENYLALYGKGAYAPLYPYWTSFSAGELDYLVFEADNVNEWRKDVKRVWCVETTRRILLKNGTDTRDFLVYVTNQNKWEATGSKGEYQSAGCG